MKIGGMSQKYIEKKNIQWDFIADKIRNEQSVLILGPEVYKTSSDSISCKDALLKHLDIPNNDNIRQHYPEDEFFLFDEPYRRTLVCHQIKSFYKSQLPNEDLAALARLPFHLYLTVTPDALLQQAFDQQSFTYQSGYYKRNKDPLVIKSPSSKSPLIYNVFGSVQSEESIILSHDDLYDYFKSIFSQQSMPEKLKIKLQEVKNFIFLGMSFDKWYMHLLLRELQIHNRHYEFTRFAAGQTLSKELHTLCQDQFQIQFVSHDIPEFIQTLLSLFSSEELRQAESSSQKCSDQAKLLLSQGKIEKCIEELEDGTEDTEFQNDITQLSGRFSKFKRRQLKGILNAEEERIQLNKISDSLLSFIGIIEKSGL